MHAFPDKRAYALVHSTNNKARGGERDVLEGLDIADKGDDMRVIASISYLPHNIVQLQVFYAWCELSCHKQAGDFWVEVASDADSEPIYPRRMLP